MDIDIHASGVDRKMAMFMVMDIYIVRLAVTITDTIAVTIKVANPVVVQVTVDLQIGLGGWLQIWVVWILQWFVWMNERARHCIVR